MFKVFVLLLFSLFFLTSCFNDNKENDSSVLDDAKINDKKNESQVFDNIKSNDLSVLEENDKDIFNKEKCSENGYEYLYEEIKKDFLNKNILLAGIDLNNIKNIDSKKIGKNIFYFWDECETLKQNKRLYGECIIKTNERKIFLNRDNNIENVDGFDFDFHLLYDDVISGNCLSERILFLDSKMINSKEKIRNYKNFSQFCIDSGNYKKYLDKVSLFLCENEKYNI